ncbi:hypothetical protein RB12837 [Rhodopirellula baltica SH 1]|uniref:Uncharacterized protein n=1 Tax=Rhodopirellula baltica (strain DSM 10527 / NCIMB 13988 / SH1) TaxID=243090 RepID=Q7UI04_RHOBA|nr:hypothetical protein RB12837 [Rhodopirellula baltica SH 1]
MRLTLLLAFAKLPRFDCVPVFFWVRSFNKWEILPPGVLSADCISWLVTKSSGQRGIAIPPDTNES